MDFFRQLFEGIVYAWGRFSLSAKVNIILAGGTSAAVIILLVVVGSRPHYVRLYTRLDLDESAQAQSFLDQESIPYKLQDGGETILVSVRDRSRALVGLGALSIPSSQGVARGFELLDTQDLLTNRWLQDVNYMRAVQGELQRQLNQFDFIDHSFVFIREATQELFIGEQQPSQASVTLKVSRPLTAMEVKAVLGVVSSFGGANLHRGNISMSTTNGRVLNAPVDDKFAALANNRLEYKAEAERYIEERIRKKFQQIGRRIIVAVSADVDWTEETIRTREVSKGQKVSTFETETSSTTTQALPEGAPGARSNLPQGVDSGGEQNTTKSNELIENFEPSTTDRERKLPSGATKSYSVAAFIEGDYGEVADDGGDGTGEREYLGLTEEQLTEYREFIAKAVGPQVSAENIAVKHHPFEIAGLAATQATVTLVAAAQTRDMMVKWGMVVAQVVLVFVGFVIVRVLLRRALVLPTTEEEEVVELAGRSPEDVRRQEVATEVARLSMEEPETVAALIRSWMSEDED